MFTFLKKLFKNIFTKKENDSAVSKGLEGEKTVNMILKKLNKDDYIVFKNITLQNDNKYAQIDHVVVSKYGIFVIETKNYSGKIYGKRQDKNWTQFIKSQKFSFYNPVKQNEQHIKVLSRNLKEQYKDKQFIFFSIVVFTGNSNIDKVQDCLEVIKENELLSHIEGFKEQRNKVVDLFFLKDFLEKNNLDSEEVAREHIKNIQDYKNNEDGLNCPRCEVRLVERNGKYGKFLGCTNYPQCFYTYKP